MTYATGAPVRFSDRAEIERILQATRAREFGVGTILHEVVQSRLFLDK
jgi:hypothetical protein